MKAHVLQAWTRPGEAGTQQTIEAMTALALGEEGVRHPEVIQYARAMTRDLASKDYRGEARRIFEIVQRDVRYALDPRGIEFLQTPWRCYFAEGVGDCDEHATVVAAFALALGHGVAFRTVKADPGRPDDWSHVYPVIGIKHQGQVEWYAADTTQDEPFGWEPPEQVLTRSSTGPSRKEWLVAPAG